MIPYFELQTIPILGSDSFAFFFLLGLLIGLIVFFKAATKKNFKTDQILEFYCFTVIPACFGAHLFNLLAYYPDQLRQDPTKLFEITGGLASLGGILSFLIFMIAYLWFEDALSSWKDWLDSSTQAFVPALLVGRIGCSLVHDHQGPHSNFFLAIDFPAGARHDAGFYELLFLIFVLMPVIVLFARRKRESGLYFVLFAFLYAPFRFLCEYVRLHDTRYFGFTPAQYSCVVLFLIGVYILLRRGEVRDRTGPESGIVGLIERPSSV